MVEHIHLEGWQELNYIFASPLWRGIAEFLETAYHNQIIYPPQDNIFRAFELSSFMATKVVILGQDPYHGEHQANGLSFAVNEGEKIPPSLANIFKEIRSDTRKIPLNSNLEYLAQQGVLLLNSTLTVEKNNPNSHAQIGWQDFTDEIISVLSEQKNHLVFMLWGANAHQKHTLIDTNKHLVLTAPHPSPLSAYRGFFGCKHFSKANEYLQQHNLTSIDWGGGEGTNDI